ncbi:integrase core domain-containing protein [Rubrivivax sp. JA1024]|nr:integrase core domain-containing protein [Rubrivivax sp. JA1024]
MADSRIVCSMCRPSNAWDNAAMESFFSSLETGSVARETSRTRNEGQAAVLDDMERLSNTTRPHSTIGYLNPPSSKAGWDSLN